jgi:IS5 family transposase
VECISKGKAHKQYEYGVKVGIVTTNKDSFVLAAKSLPGNPYDGHTLKECLDQAQRTCGVAATQVFVDRGYKGHGCSSETCQVLIAGAKRGITPALKRELKRRNAIEPVIGHMKSDTRLSRNFLKGTHGDAINALLSAAAHNLRKVLAKLRLLCAQWGIGWLELMTALRVHRQIA